MRIIATRRLKTYARIVLCAYVLLLGVESFHNDPGEIVPQSATLNNGTPHLAHGIINERVECPICQGAFSQIPTGEFRLTVFNIVAVMVHTPPTLHPQLPSVEHHFLRGPPLSA